MKRKITSAVIFLGTTLAMAAFLDAVYGAGPVTLHVALIHLVIVGTIFFALGCIFSFFIPRFEVACGVAGSILSWPYFAIQIFKVPWHNVFSILPYANWLYELIAMLALVIASIYSASRVWRLAVTNATKGN
jgi:hypothetical protein